MFTLVNFRQSPVSYQEVVELQLNFDVFLDVISTEGRNDMPE